MKRPLQAWLRTETWKRDKGVCATCGLDTVKLIAKLEKKRVKPTWLIPGKEGRNHRLNAVRYMLELWGAPRTHKSLWQCDHVWELADGGPDTLENCQTLCLRCHRSKGSRRAGPRAKVKRTSRKFAKHRDAMASKFPFGA